MTGERGSASLYVLVAALAVVAVAAALLAFATTLVAGARARSAADLAALGGAARAWSGPDGACAAAGRVASANGARMRSCRADPDATVTVSVEVGLPGWLSRVGAARAAARAGPDDPAR